jgi:hypothetical protein
MSLSPERSARVHELATGLALGELDEGELAELLDLVRDPVDGAAAAEAAWTSLGTALDLRAGLSERMVDTVALRIADRDGAFADRLRARIGAARARLQPVPPPPARRRPLLAIVIGLAVVAAVAAALLWPRSGPPAPRQAAVTAVTGVVAHQDGALVPGSRIALDGPVAVPAGAALTLAWDGRTVSATGPALLVPQDGGIVLTGGRAAVSAGVATRIALSDTAVNLDAGTVVAEAGPPARIGVLDGSVRLPDGILRPGLAWSPGAPVLPWSEEPWNGRRAVGETVLRHGRILVDLPWSAPGDRWELMVDDRPLVVAPGRLGDLTLDGAPLQPDRLVIDLAGARVRVTVRGQGVSVPAGFLTWTAVGVPASAAILIGPER